MSGQTGIKETIYQIFDIVFPADLGNVALGINEYQELAESFRKLVDVAIEENEEMTRAYVEEQTVFMHEKVNEMNVQIIEKNAQLQETARVNELLSTHHNQAIQENERLAHTINQLEQQNRDLEQQIEEVTQNEATKENQIYHLQEQIKAKDEQISKLTEEINKPKANIVIPSQGKSANLQELMEEARNKKVKSALDLALSGQVHRGKVELAIPPSYNGGNDTSESTFQDFDEIIVEDNWVPTSEVPSVEAPTPRYEEEKVAGLDEYATLPEDNGPITWESLKSLEGRIEARLLRIEQQTGLA